MIAELALLLLLSLGACGEHRDEASGIGIKPDLGEQDWTTPAERDEFRSSPSFAETMAWLDRLDAASTAVDIQTFGQTAQGREMKLVVISPEGAFTPESAHKTGKPVVLVLNGIHSAEICGKDASLILLRELLVEGKYPAVLDAMTLLVVPVYNIDGHERPDHRFNRFNQDGPEEGMGFRTNARGMDLNRDFMKLDTVEAQNLISSVMVRWDPQLMIDNHT
ncbi:MAG: peptidase M14, partial [Proteobacteria bacterium]|nr:peptidase M14 [Pseudomonadota bacterium]